MGETKKKLTVRWKEHRANVDTTLKDTVFNQGERKQSETGRNMSAIMDAKPIT